MEIWGIVVCAVCAAVFNGLLKRNDREYALLFTLAVSAALTASVLRRAGPLLSQLQELAGADSALGEVLPPVLKAVGIAVAGEMAAHLCRDAGESALAHAVDLAVKAAVLGVSLPLVTRVLEYLKDIIAL